MNRRIWRGRYLPKPASLRVQASESVTNASELKKKTPRPLRGAKHFPVLVSEAKTGLEIHRAPEMPETESAAESEALARGAPATGRSTLFIAHRLSTPITTP